MAPPRKRVAIVGSGCSGIAALWALKRTDHDVYLYEAAARLGGHTNTVQWKGGKYSVGVDTGFIVLNTATYPNFINFLKKVNVETERTPMTFGVSRDQGTFEWAGTSLAAIFCQPRNIFSRRMWRLIFDIIRFNQFSLDVLLKDGNGDEAVGEYLNRNGYSDAFRDDYLIPMTAAIWSTSPGKCIDEFPLLTLVRFFWNHHLMSTVSSRPDWLTLKNGSKTYIDAVMKEFSSGKVSLNTPVHKVSNDNNGRVTLHMANDETETFDHVVLATHGDQALSILGDSATNVERAVLSSFKTSQNEAVLHSDLTHMPRNREAWSSWNYMTLSSSSRSYTDQVSLTYNMNILQHIPRKQFGDVLVTLNPLHPPNPTLTQGRFQYSHPLYTSEAIRAQSLLHTIQNKRGISYAGAWTKYGFHEDGFTSGLQVAQDHLGAKLPFELVDSKTSRGKPELGLADHLLRFVILFIQVFVIQTLEVFAGTSRRQAAKPVKEVKQK